MKIKKTLKIMLLTTLLSYGGFGFAQDETKPFTPAQEAALNTFVEHYIMSHPYLLKQMADNYAKAAEQTKVDEQKKLINDLKEPIFNSKTSPVLGNPKGTITLVEFEDYQCINCQHMYPVVQSLIAHNPDLKVIIKEFPIFGDASSYAAKKALTYGFTGDYLKIHSALFESGIPEGQLTQDAVNQLINKAGLANKAIPKHAELLANNEIEQNASLAKQLSIPGTPAFIILKTPEPKKTIEQVKMLAGATSEGNLQNIINSFKGK